jgi:DNA primase
MRDPQNHPVQPRLSLLDFLAQYGWKPARDRGGDEVAGLCPLHRDRHPSFYVNRRKQVFYCHGCGRGGGLARLIELLGSLSPPVLEWSGSASVLEHTYQFYQWHLARCAGAQQYLGERGIYDPAIVERLRIGYAPGACLHGYLQGLGVERQALTLCGLVDQQGRDTFFRSLTFPLVEAANLYGRSVGNPICRHRFLPGSKGGLYGLRQALAWPRVILVEGLFDLAALWQAGFDEAVCALGSHLNNQQLAEISGSAGKHTVYLCFDADRNGSGQRAARGLSIQLRHAGVEALRVELPAGHDPASFFAAGASAADFQRLLVRALP